MTIQAQVMSDTPNALSDTRNVWYLLHDDETAGTTFELKTIEQIYGRLEAVQLSPETLWEAGASVPGTATSRKIMWGAYMQKTDDPIRGNAIAAIYELILSQGNAATVLATAGGVLSASDFQALLLANTTSLFTDASDTEFRQLMALALAIVLGRLGQAGR